jgi:hypothetical protein
LRGEQRLRVFENGVLRKTSVLTRDEATAEWRRLHAKELHGLYSSPNIIRENEIKKNKMGRACGLNGVEKRCIQGFGAENRMK